VPLPHGILIFGGEAADDEGGPPPAEMYDLDTCAWTALPVERPVPVGATAASIGSGSWIVVGGGGGARTRVEPLPPGRRCRHLGSPTSPPAPPPPP
jgi:hypothetical protein